MPTNNVLADEQNAKTTSAAVENEKFETADTEDVASEIKTVPDAGISEDADKDGIASETAHADNTAASDTTTSRSEVLAEKRKNEQERAKRNLTRETTRMKWEGLKSSLREKRILTSRVISIQEVAKRVIAVLNVEGFKVMVPCSEMYVKPPLDMSTVNMDTDRIRREKQILQKLLGSEIPFLITDIAGSPEGDYVIVGSRKAALTRMADRNFTKRKYDGKSRISEGDTVDAVAVTVGQHAVWANVGGIDVSIPIFLLTHRYVAEATEMYRPGQIFPVYINKIEYDAEGHVKKLNVSGRIPEIAEFLPRLKQIVPGESCLGRITSIRKSRSDESRTIITLFLEHAEVPAIASYTRYDTLASPPLTGDTVIFSVYKVNEEHGVVTGTILRRA